MRAVAIKALQCGSIPQHIGLIMDGNRRYGRKVHVGNGKGYYLGYETLEEVRSLVCVKYLHQFIFFFFCVRRTLQLTIRVVRQLFGCMFRFWQCVWRWALKLLRYMLSALRTLRDRPIKWRHSWNWPKQSLPNYVNKGKVIGRTKWLPLTTFIFSYDHSSIRLAYESLLLGQEVVRQRGYACRRERI